MNHNTHALLFFRCVETLAKITGDKGISLFMKMCQQRLNHLLPLGAYLLKPVQRVLKYSLLLEVSTYNELLNTQY